MEIRRAEVEDLPIIVDMKINMFQEVGSAALLQDNVEEKIQRTYADLYREDKCCHFLAYDEEGRAAACGGAVIKEDVPFCFFKNPCYGYVIDVYCVPEKRRNGYASGIMTEILNWLEEKGVHNVKLKPSGVGRMMYEKMGFHDSGEMEKWM